MRTRYRMAAIALLFVSTVSGAQTSARVFLEDFTSAELGSKLSRSCPVLLVFSGGTEATGPHIALGKHNFRVRTYGEAIARRLADAVVAPVLPFAPNSPELQRFPGTITLAESTFSRVNEEVVRSLLATGFRRVALLSDHFNSQQPLRELAARLDAEYARKGSRVFFVSDGYLKARQQIEAELKSTGHVPGGHGGLWDTSETLAARPSAVRPGEFRPGTLADDGNGPPDGRGVSGDPRGASSAMGRRFGELRVRLASDELRTQLRSAGPCR
jgi:creatinine amidohydrolase